MTQEELNYIKEAFSQIIDDIAGNPDWNDAARAVASALGTLERELEENRVYKHEGPTFPAFWPPCYFGGECTNPSRNCIICPRQSIIGINTTTGTSTAKVEG